MAPARRPAASASAAHPQTRRTSEWRTVPPENLLVIDTTKGRVLVELTPEIAPLHVERMRLLARNGFFDGLTWHRVIDWFMAQTGDPLGNGEGQSAYPDLKAEFTFRRESRSAVRRRGRAPPGRGSASCIPCRSRPSPIQLRH
jgi:peptidylprolyl isomerase